MKNTSLWRRPEVILGTLISVACLVFVLLVVDRDELVESLERARYGYLLLAAIGILAFQFLRAVRWRFMLSPDLSLSQVFDVNNVGYMINYLLPLRVGEAARAVLIGNVPPMTVARGLSTMIVERVLDLLFIVVLFPFTVAFVPTIPDEVRSVALGSGVVAISAAAALIAAANRRLLARRIMIAVLDRLSFLNTETWVRRGDELLNGLDSLTRWRDGVILLLLSILVWLPVILAYYVGQLAFDLEPTLATAAFTMCMAAFGISAPSSPGGIGVYQVAVTVALVTVLGRASGPSTGFAFLFFVMNLLVIMILGALGMFRLGATLERVITAARTVGSRSGA